MRFLCLPGAYGSAENYKVQLGPFISAVSSDTISFTFTQGTIPCTPPDGFENYFGPPPHYRFVSYDGLSGASDVLEKIRDMPAAPTAEEALRLLLPSGGDGVKNSMREALDAIYETMEREGPFDGILGYSEGATVAATLILDEKRKWEEDGRERMIKCAIFFCGWPPLRLDGQGMILSDDTEQVVDIPTTHIVGAGDPYLHGAMALYNVCEEDTANFFDHGKGHTLPRDARTLNELSEVIGRMIECAEG